MCGVCSVSACVRECVWSYLHVWEFASLKLFVHSCLTLHEQQQHTKHDQQPIVQPYIRTQPHTRRIHTAHTHTTHHNAPLVRLFVVCDDVCMRKLNNFLFVMVRVLQRLCVWAGVWGSELVSVCVYICVCVDK